MARFADGAVRPVIVPGEVGRFTLEAMGANPQSDRGRDRAPSPTVGRLDVRPLLQDHPAALRVALLAWGMSAFIFLALVIPPLRSLIDTIDEAVHDLAVAAEWGPLVRASDWLDVIGSVWVTFPFIGLVAIWLGVRRHWEALTTWLLTMAISQVLIGPVKDLYARARPPDPLVVTTSYSFPSGHSVAGAAIAVAAVIVLIPAGPARRNLEMVAAGFAVAMALSRVYLRAHWLTDVAAGAALGTAIAVGVAASLHAIDERRRARSEAEQP